MEASAIWEQSGAILLPEQTNKKPNRFTGRMFKEATISLAFLKASNSETARKSETPETLLCISAPCKKSSNLFSFKKYHYWSSLTPSSSSSASSPVAIFTKGGPPKNMSPFLATMIV
jgi:hypothetical protein